MAATTTLLTMITPAPFSHNELLIKRAEVTCGDLRGAYPNVQAPVCSGATSICTFSNALQGCCDSSGSCQFYTTCNGRYSPATCTDKQCISCSSAAPYCIKYNFYDSAARQGFDGYSCGAFDVGSLTVQGYPSTVGVQSTTTSSSQNSTSGSQTLTSTSVSAAATESSTPSSSTSSSHAGAIAGGVVGGIGGLVLLLGAAWLYRRHRRRQHNGSRHRSGRGRPELQQNYGDGDSQSFLPTRH